MGKIHYAQENKKRVLDAIVEAINKAGEASLKEINIEFYHKLGISPKTVEKYLEELESLDMLVFSKKEKVVRSMEFMENINKAVNILKNKGKLNEEI